jgi:Icc-related predicted phosphoesterase
MPFKRKRSERALRVFFCTDIHGSDRCFRKFLAAAGVYDADVLLLGGDVVGKAMVPIERREQGGYRYSLFGEEHVLDESELDSAMAAVNFNGFYPTVVDSGELTRMREDQTFRHERFLGLIREQMESWEALTKERLDGKTRCILTPGNDDPTVVDDVFSASDRIEFTELKTVEVGPVWLSSLGNTNRTPWDTEREYDESELTEQIRTMVGPYADGRPLVFNFHCPPYDSGLDTVAKLDENFRPVTKNNAVVEIPAGSTAVRDAIKEFQPVAALHGHVHEAQGVRTIGNSTCFNPGSDYSAGTLKGLIVDFDGDGVLCGHLFTSG